MMMNILYLLIFLLTPALVLWMCKKVKILGKIGPVLILYLLGLIIGNIGYKPASMAQLQDILSSAMVPIAIPLMLFSCTFKKAETRSQVLALITGMLAVVITIFIGYFIFGENTPDGAKVGGLLTGVYSGGTINLASLKTMLDVKEETFILLNSYDMVISFIYLLFLMSVGYKLFRKFLPNITNTEEDSPSSFEQPVNKAEKVSFKEYWKDLWPQLAIAVIIIGVSAGLGALTGAFLVVFILSLTTLSIAASFLKCLKGRKYGYDVGMYCIYIFSIVVASMADFSTLDLAGSLNLMGYLTFAIFVSLFIQILLAKIFRIDSDTTVISSVAFICSPPFVPMMAASMRNKRIIASGLAIGVVGYAVGNYLGYLIYLLLGLL